MLYREMTIKSSEGLNSRTAARLVKAAERFESQILIEFENKKVNAKSIMGVLSLNTQCGGSIFVLANGPDEQQALDALEAATNLQE